MFRNTSADGYPRFCVSQARVFVVLGVCPGTCVVPLRSVSSVLDTLTPVFELYVRLRERRQRAATCVFSGVDTIVVVVGERRLTSCGLTLVVCPVVGTCVKLLHEAMRLVLALVRLWFLCWYLVVVGTCTLRGYLFLVVRCVPVFSDIVEELCSVKVV
ncbi:hypothetical protein Taro_039952, partial [Colocasia esculenta]|nr:hypothetical protein [Colocasia esculenta]